MVARVRLVSMVECCDTRRWGLREWYINDASGDRQLHQPTHFTNCHNYQTTMKFTLLAALSTLALVAASPAEPRGATVSSAEEFYFPSRNITCHHAGENGVQCENGHLRDAQVVSHPVYL